MMDGRLSRVSELSESESSTGSRGGGAPNFSRPRPHSYESQELVVPERNPDRLRNKGVHAISAFHEPNRNLPDEPRFSLESDRTQQTSSSDNSAGSDLAWDGERGELISRPPRKRFDDQRYSKDPRARPMTSKTNSSTTSSLSAFANNRQQNPSLTQIHKRVSVDIQSDRMSLITNDQYEDTASHHTVSDDDESGSFDPDGEWRSSDYDTSGLSDAKIRKLLKKGVNPSLYAEMQAAKKKSKSKWIGPLVGNSFIG